MYKLTIEKDAQDDLRGMISEGGAAKTAAARIVAFLQELKQSPSQLSELLTRGFKNDTFNVDKFISLYDTGLNLWRVALYEFDFDTQKRWQMPYRILYGYDQPCYTFRVLGVLPRNFNYETDHDLTKRICRAYDNLGMPKHKPNIVYSRRDKPT